MLGLAGLGIALGFTLLLLLRAVSNQEAIRNIRRQIQACLYELRLFVDEPGLIWQAQGRLLRLNLHYLGLMLRPALILALPMLVLFSFLEPFYGKAPIPVRSQSIVTVKLRHSPGALIATPVLQAPDGIQVESPAVRMHETGQVCWRIRAVKPTSGMLRVVFPTEIVTKRIVSGIGPEFLSMQRVRLSWRLLLHPTEHPLPAGNVDWIAIDYPSRTIGWLGFELPWFIWLLLFSMATALVLMRPLRITF
ncbi:MAG TPA: hypothetical protein VLI55_16630 [Bryobacteraceae bacterium]|nr:hypothetical protein [Bryobacteraceae bacterium]